MGTAWLILGLCDVAYLIACLARGSSYTPGLNVFGVVAGASLLRGSARAAMIVRFASGLLLTFAVAALLAIALLRHSQLRDWLHSADANVGLPFAAATLAVLAWTRWQLRG